MVTKGKDQQGNLFLVVFFLAALRKSVVSFKVDQLRDEAISAFHGFLSLPVEFEVEVPRRAPSARYREEGFRAEEMSEASVNFDGNVMGAVVTKLSNNHYEFFFRDDSQDVRPLMPMRWAKSGYLSNDSYNEKVGGSAVMAWTTVFFLLPLMEMFLAGSDTTSSTMEWALVELPSNPNSMRKFKENLDNVIGPNRKAADNDINELPDLQVIVKETFRLRPIVPLLLPRNAVQNNDYMGYFIPKDTQVFVNAWAIGRDQDLWDDPLSFKPERFLGSNIEYKGQYYELIPYGSGRRICVGFSLAHRVVQLGLATLLHSFD